MRIQLLLSFLILTFGCLSTSPEGETIAGTKQLVTTNPPDTTISTDTTLGESQTQPLETDEPIVDDITSTVAPHESPPPETNPPKVYLNGSVGSHKKGDLISYLGVEGRIASGTIEDGKVPTKNLTLLDASNNVVLFFGQKLTDGIYYEMLQYPLHGDVYLKINGKDSGYVFTYDNTKNIDFYISIYYNADKASAQQHIKKKP